MAFFGYSIYLVLDWTHPARATQTGPTTMFVGRGVGNVPTDATTAID
jgi:hypothetical protein